jgi:hypothetical protein
VNRLGDEAFSRPRFTGDEHPRFGCRRPFDEAVDVSKARPGADQQGRPALLMRLKTVNFLNLFQRRRMQQPLDGQDDFLNLNGLGEIVVNAGFERLDGIFITRKRRQQQDFHGVI